MKNERPNMTEEMKNFMNVLRTNNVEFFIEWSGDDVNLIPIVNNKSWWAKGIEDDETWDMILDLYKQHDYSMEIFPISLEELDYECYHSTEFKE